MSFITTRIKEPLLNWVNFWRQTLPVIQKDLRLTSRLGRTYLLRLLFVGSLLLFMWACWSSWMSSADQAFKSYHAADVGESVVKAILAFQFVISQLIAVILLSSGMNEEIQKRTLATLMTTPLNCMHIVTGKLFGKLWSLLIILAITMPVLAIMRVFGGVPWDVVIFGVTITIAASLFSASVSLYNSVATPQPYMVVLKSLWFLSLVYLGCSAVLGVLFGCLFGFMIVTVMKYLGASVFYVVLEALIVCAMLIGCRIALRMAAAASFVAAKQQADGQPITPLSDSLGQSIYIATANRRVNQRTVELVSMSRPAACVAAKPPPLPPPSALAPRPAPPAKPAAQELIELEPAKLPPPPLPKRLAPIDLARLTAAPPPGASSRIRRVDRPAIIWKETLPKENFFDGLWPVLYFVVSFWIVAAVIYTFTPKASAGGIAICAAVMVIPAAVATVIFSAGTISSERQAGTWMLLLTIPSSNWDIFFSKAASVFDRCKWLLLPPVIYALICTIGGRMHPLASLCYLLIAEGLICLLVAMGILISSSAARTNSALVVNMLMALVLLFVPNLFLNFKYMPLRMLSLISPIEVISKLAEAGFGPKAMLPLDQHSIVLSNYAFSVWRFTGRGAWVCLFGAAGLYFGLAYLMAWTAQHAFRRQLFAGRK